MAKAKKKRVLLCDASNYLHRGHWAIVGSSGQRAKLTNSDGFGTTGIRGMINILLADLAVLQPDVIVVVYDSKQGSNWRKVLYPEYKKGAARVAAKKKMKESGDNLFEQIRPLQRILRAMGIPQLGVASEEADDVIGTLAVEFEELGYEVLISSKDKDFGSLVNKNIKMVEATTRRLLGSKAVKEKFGVAPSKMVDYLMLQGDGVDNIPGVKRCGPKTAAKLLEEYGSVKDIVANRHELTPAMRDAVTDARKKFKLTRKLLTIKTTIKHDLDLTKCKFREPKYDKLESLCAELQLATTHRQILKTLENLRHRK